MRAYDALPPALRRWLAGAARPWSPASCLRLWRETIAAGGAEADALARLDRAERAALARDAAFMSPPSEVRPEAARAQGFASSAPSS